MSDVAVVYHGGPYDGQTHYTPEILAKAPSMSTTVDASGVYWREEDGSYTWVADLTFPAAWKQPVPRLEG